MRSVDGRFILLLHREMQSRTFAMTHDLHEQKECLLPPQEFRK